MLRNHSSPIFNEIFSLLESILTVFPKEFDINQCVQHASQKGSVIQHLCFFFRQLGTYSSIEFPDHTQLFKDVNSIC